MLQLPDGLRRRGAAVALALEKEGFEVTLDGNPCYGACDLSREGLERADVLVHAGHTPLGDGGDRVVYVPLRLDAGLESVEEAVPLLRGRVAGLVATAQYAHLLPGVADLLVARGIEARVGGPTARTPLPGQVLGCSFGAARETGADEILYLGTGTFHPLGVTLATRARVIACDPCRGTAEEVDPDRLLRRRFALIERAREAATVGVLLSTRSGQRREPLARRLAALARGRAVVIAIEEVTPGALLNLGFDAYVNTACPRLAYDDAARFPAPVLSPPEFEIATGLRSWDDYAVDEVG